MTPRVYISVSKSVGTSRDEKLTKIPFIHPTSTWSPSRDTTAVKDLLANFLCTRTAVLEFNYEGEARESFRTPSFWKQKRRAARFATSCS